MSKACSIAGVVWRLAKAAAAKDPNDFVLKKTARNFFLAVEQLPNGLPVVLLTAKT